MAKQFAPRLTREDEDDTEKASKRDLPPTMGKTRDALSKAAGWAKKLGGEVAGEWKKNGKIIPTMAAGPFNVRGAFRDKMKAVKAQEGLNSKMNRARSETSKAQASGTASAKNNIMQRVTRATRENPAPDQYGSDKKPEVPKATPKRGSARPGPGLERWTSATGGDVYLPSGTTSAQYREMYGRAGFKATGDKYDKK